MYVIKRDKRKEKFSKAKLARSIEKSTKEGKVSSINRKIIANEIVRAILEKIKNRKYVKAVDLREMVLSRLERKSKAALVAWKRYDKKRH